MFNLIDSRWLFTTILILTHFFSGMELAEGQTKGKFSILERREPAAQSVIRPSTQPAPLPKLETKPGVAPVDASEDFNRLITRFVLDSMPHSYVEDKDWGQTSERWNGLSVERDGLRLKTHRKKKTVNHGTWKKYSAKLIDPEETFTLQLRNLHELSSRKVGFDLICQSRLAIDARQSKWVKGVQLYSLSANGHARIELKASVEVEFKTDIKNLPPDLLIRPVVTDIQLEVRDFRIDRVSKAGGEFAQQVTRAAQSALEKKIDQQEDKLLKKLNAKIGKSHDKLRISFSKAMKSRWWNSAKQFIPHATDSDADQPSDKARLKKAG